MWEYIKANEGSFVLLGFMLISFIMGHIVAHIIEKKNKNKNQKIRRGRT